MPSLAEARCQPPTRARHDRPGDRHRAGVPVDYVTEAACLENLGALMFDQGRFGVALQYVQQAHDLCLSIGGHDFRAHAVLYEAKIYIRSGATDRDLKLSIDAFHLLQEWNYSPFYTGMTLRAGHRRSSDQAPAAV
jgi:hypothetical protein